MIPEQDFHLHFQTQNKNFENPVLRTFFALKPNGNACYAGYFGSTGLIETFWRFFSECRETT